MRIAVIGFLTVVGVVYVSLSRVYPIEPKVVSSVKTLHGNSVYSSVKKLHGYSPERPEPGAFTICGMHYNLLNIATTKDEYGARIQKVLTVETEKSFFTLRIPIFGVSPPSGTDPFYSTPTATPWARGDVVQGRNCSQGYGSCASCGKYDPRSWTAVSSTTLQVSFSGGDSTDCPGRLPRRSIVQFVCGDEASAKQTMTENPTCVYNFVFVGPSFCDLGPTGRAAYNLFPIAISSNVSAAALASSHKQASSQELGAYSYLRTSDTADPTLPSSSSTAATALATSANPVYVQQLHKVSRFILRVPVAGQAPPAYLDPTGRGWLAGDIIQGGSVSCGQYDPCSWTLLRATSKQGATLQVTYHSGDYCSEAKAPRRSVVQFVCSGETSQTVTEGPPCVYHFAFHDSSYCILPMMPDILHD